MIFKKILILVVLVAALILVVEFSRQPAPVEDASPLPTPVQHVEETSRPVPITDKNCIEKDRSRTCKLVFSENGPEYTIYFDHFVLEIKSENFYQKISLDDEGYGKGYDWGFVSNFMLPIDVNLDGYKDLAIKSCEGATGNVCYKFYLYNPTHKLFEYSAEFTQANAFPDLKTKLLHNHVNMGCAGECYNDYTYKIENNKPVLIKEIKQEGYGENPLFTKVTRELINGQFVTSTTTSKSP